MEFWVYINLTIIMRSETHAKQFTNHNALDYNIKYNLPVFHKSLKSHLSKYIR